MEGRSAPSADPQLGRRMKTIGLSLGVAILLMAAKFYSFYLTRSSAIFSDALESIINVVASAFAMGSIWMAAKPPDPEHPYGHGKIEYFSAGFEGALIILAAFGIFKTGISQIHTATPLNNLDVGLGILVAASLVNLLLGWWLIRVGRQSRSLALVADGKHVLADVYTSVGVVSGLVLVHLTQWLWLDGAIACLVGIHILFIGARLIRESFSGLMDTSDPELLDTISRLVETHRTSTWIDVHQLRAWQSGRVVHIDLHIVLPRQFYLDQAHSDAKTLERLLFGHFGKNADILVHMDPCESADCPVCRVEPCELREQPLADLNIWDRQTTTTIRREEESS